MNSSLNITNTNISKDNRVRVGVRCRPAFQDEIDFAKGNFFSIVNPVQNINSPYEQLALTLSNGKQREFSFDYVFVSNDTQDYVYDQIARPVVDDVLKGYNGTVFAYGQTGTGKTYTMGILEFINNEHAGIIPRALSQIFNIPFEQQSTNKELVVSLSFLQIYRESIQDLLAPAASGNSATVEDNLLIREDPNRGFYVEGLQEFIVRNYNEAEALINLGLENRAIAPTLMNSTSSRSHTVLTLTIEQRVVTELNSQKGVTISGTHSEKDQQHHRYTRTLRSKLLMVDLAGSERVRRTVSKGTRLSEAKSINTSLSALGNVIAALADQNSSHIPYRDSKLTRLLQDSLGGTARTALIATIGPAAMNYGETLSTLLFASRCMAVKIIPMQHAEVDYVEMCAALQAKVNEMDGEMTKKLLEQQEVFDYKLNELNNQLKLERSSSTPQEIYRAIQEREVIQERTNSELRVLLDQIEKLRTTEDNDIMGESGTISCSWLGKPLDWSPSDSCGSDEAGSSNYDAQRTAILAYCFKIIAQVSNDLNIILEKNTQREQEIQQTIEKTLENKDLEEKKRKDEKRKLFNEDPRCKLQIDPTVTSTESQVTKIGSHLATLSMSDAIRKVETQFRSNNDHSLVEELRVYNQSKAKYVVPLPAIYNYNSIEELLVAITSMNQSICENVVAVTEKMAIKDAHFSNLKNELAVQLMEKRKREEEVINWSYILKYLLTSSSKLKKRIKEENQDSNSITSTSNDKQNLITTIRPEENSRKIASTSDLNSRFLLSIQQHQPSRPTIRSSNNQFQKDIPEIVSSKFEDDPKNNAINVKSTFEKVRANRLPVKGLVSQNPNNLDAMDRSSSLLYHTPLTESALHHASAASSPVSRRANSVDDSELSVSSTGLSVRSSFTNLSNFNSHHHHPQNTKQHLLSSLQYPMKQQPIMTPHPQQQQKQLLHNTNNNNNTNTRSSIEQSHSIFARNVVEELGVNKNEASAAMSVIDKVSKITDQQLSMLDPITRQQILQIRADLGINSKRNIESSVNYNHPAISIPPPPSRRASSAPRVRSNNTNETIAPHHTPSHAVLNQHIHNASNRNQVVTSHSVNNSSLNIGSQHNKYNYTNSSDKNLHTNHSRKQIQLSQSKQHQSTYDIYDDLDEDEEYSQLDFI